MHSLTRSFFWLAGLWLLSTQAGAVLEIEITRGQEGAAPIAIVPFAWEGEGQPPEEIAAIVSNDLRSSGYFDPTPEARQPQEPVSEEEIEFTSWRRQGVPHLVLGSVTETGDDAYDVEFQLYDVLRRRLVTSYGVPAAGDELRAAAHKVSDLVFEELTGMRGAFGTRIAFVSVESEGEDRRYKLQVADADGYNATDIFRSEDPLLSPAWSPDGRRVAYVSFENDRPQIYVQTVATGDRTLVPVDEGLASAPAFSPDGERLALTVSVNGNPDVYVMDLTTESLSRLTSSSAIDTEPAWMPDGGSLIFTSDRSGSPQLYRVSASGGNPKRLTFEGRYNSDANVSPDGEQVAMVHNDGGGFGIAVMGVDGGALRVLTDGQLDESPSFAPNGASIIYAAVDRGENALAAVSEDGRVRQRLTQRGGGEVREPAWAPFRD